MAPTLRERAPPGTSALPSLPNPSSSSGAASAGESSTTARETAGRIRSNSLQQALEVVPTTFGAAAELEESDEVLNRARDGAVEEGTSSKKLATLERTGTALPEIKHVEMAESTEEVTGRPTFLSDLVTFRWMSSIRSSLTLILLILAAYGLLEIFPSLSPLGVIPVPSYTPHLPHPENPLAHLLFISYPLPHTSATVGGAQLYSKGRLDIAFLGFYIIVFSFLRLVVTRFLVRPLALALGLGKGGGKGAEGLLLRFMEQGYAFVYFFCSSALGLVSPRSSSRWTDAVAVRHVRTGHLVVPDRVLLDQLSALVRSFLLAHRAEASMQEDDGRAQVVLPPPVCILVSADARPRSPVCPTSTLSTN